ncbi:hypothetical protein BGZ61DRAFT_423853 [Ilyonectria robusta]|uniref:uncharacterized protein n=1 Tax=Ilyonectria robusta TaxID=1079257 RepID=UPI001E8CE558|nr:uncharacterized protein BGZ61DRAFT_423853 [Ilyonectria robusta]KAH8685299.1 hypothetical protein BGZ61DRAFT_423853 [Ilyonectria robusta]
MSVYRNALAVIGAGGLGLAIARRLGPGQRVVLADYSQKALDTAAESLRDHGHEVETRIVDVSSYESVTELAKFAAATGQLNTVVNAAGISLNMGTAKRVYEIDLLGTANVLDAFIEVMAPGSSLITISSLAGHMAGPAVSPDLEMHLATAPTDKLLSHPDIKLDGDSGLAYGIAKKGNIVRVQAAAVAGKTNGIRVNSVSSGVTATAMIRHELQTQAGATIRAMVESSLIPRAGTSDDVANVVAFLASPDACFIDGTDILVDGGGLASQRFTAAAGSS